jgi:hypothetical protein
MSPLPNSIKFRVPREPMDEKDDGISPYIHLKDPTYDIEHLENADEIVTGKDIRIRFIYPLNGEFIFEYHKVNQGYTRKELAKLISDEYKRIYAEEEEDAGDPGMIPGMYNRLPSHGRYGIWGHYLSDLLLYEVRFDGHVYNLGIDS